MEEPITEPLARQRSRAECQVVEPPKGARVGIGTVGATQKLEGPRMVDWQAREEDFAVDIWASLFFLGGAFLGQAAASIDFQATFLFGHERM